LNEPRGHHYVPQFYLRSFANARGQLLVERRDRSKSYFTTVKCAAKRHDFYKMETDGGDSFAVEKALGKVEDLAAPVLKRMIAGSLPSNEDEREAFASFVALQFLRGIDNRAAAENLMMWAGRFVLKNLTPEMVADTIRRTVNREPFPGEVDEHLEYAETEDVVGKHLKPHPNYTITMSLQAMEGCARIAFARTIRLLRWNEPMLLTSDTPVALYSSKPPPPMMGLGLGTADQIVLPLSRYTAAVLYAPHLKQPETIWEDPELRFSTMVNYLAAENAMESIFVHPDDVELLSDIVDLPPVRERGEMSPKEPPRVAPRRVIV